MLLLHNRKEESAGRGPLVKWPGTKACYSIHFVAHIIAALYMASLPVFSLCSCFFLSCVCFLFFLLWTLEYDLHIDITSLFSSPFPSKKF